MSKNKIFFLILISIISIILLCMFNDIKKSKNDSTSSTDYAERMAYIEKKNGWYFYMYENNFKELFFDGCNLKYPNLKGYYINIYTDKTETVIYEKIPTFATLSTSDFKKNNKLERDEVVEIDNFFNEKQFNRKVEEIDLNDLNLENFDKKDILTLYNTLQDKNYSDYLTKFKLSECKILEDNFDSGYKLNVGILAERKGIAVVRIDIVYNDNQYLSDLVQNDKATNSQKEIFNNFKKIEQYIVSNQEIDIQDNFDLTDDIYLRLFSVLRKVEKWKD